VTDRYNDERSTSKALLERGTAREAVLEAEMTKTIGAEKSERTATRLCRTLVTRVGNAGAAGATGSGEAVLDQAAFRGTRATGSRATVKPDRCDATTLVAISHASRVDRENLKTSTASGADGRHLGSGRAHQTDPWTATRSAGRGPGGDRKLAKAVIRETTALLTQAFKTPSPLAAN
jgi:hypothetical protein